MNVSTEVKTHVATTIGGGAISVTPQQVEYLKQADMNELVTIDGHSFRVHQVTEIITAEEYFYRNPNKRVERPVDFRPPERESLSDIQRRQAMTNLVKGFEGYFKEQGRIPPPHAVRLLERWGKRLGLAS